MNLFPPDVTYSVGVYHLPTTSGAVQSYPASADATIEGAFLPLDRKEHAFEGGGLMNLFELYVAPDADVRVGDKLVIDSTNYYAKKVFAADFGGLAHKRVSLSVEP